MSRSPDRARQVTGEDELGGVEGLDMVAVGERGGFVEDDDDGNDNDDEEDDDTDEGFVIVVVKVDKRCGVAVQADARKAFLHCFSSSFVLASTSGDQNQ